MAQKKPMQIPIYYKNADDSPLPNSNDGNKQNKRVRKMDD